jgi:hypothetical protein
MASKYQIMTPKQLRAARVQLGFKPGQMAARIKTPVRTYQDWESGMRPISGACDTAVELLLRDDARFMAQFRPAGAQDPLVANLAMMVKLLCRALLKAVPSHLLPLKYMDFLTRNNLQGSPLREGAEA